MKRTSQRVAVLLAQRLGRLDGRVRDLLVVLDRLKGRLREILRVLAAEELGVLGLVVGVVWVRDEGEDGGDGEGDGGGGLEGVFEDVDLVLKTGLGAVGGGCLGWGKDGEEWVNEDVVGVEADGMDVLVVFVGRDIKKEGEI